MSLSLLLYTLAYVVFMHRFWDFILFLLPVCLGLLLIPGVFNDWWKIHVVPVVGGGLCVGWPLLVMIFFRFVIPGQMHDESRGPYADFLKSIEENATVFVQRHLFVSDSLIPAIYKTWSQYELSPMLTGHYQISFGFAEGEKFPLIHRVILEHMDASADLTDFEDETIERILVETGELIVLADMVAEDFSTTSHPVCARLDQHRQQLIDLFSIISVDGIHISGFVVSPFYGDGDYHFTILKKQGKICKLVFETVPFDE